MEQSKRFDKKFGSTFVQDLPTGPGVYLFRDNKSEVIYVGKAKNLRRRLQNYRNATRRKVHRKMRTLIREAVSIEIRREASEEEALLKENALIVELNPTYNVEGAYAFLYPTLGVGSHNKLMLLSFTTDPLLYHDLDMNWYGSFRSRPRVKAAFGALVELLSLIGHLEKRNRLPQSPSKKGSRLVGLRQIPIELVESLPWFFAGEEPTFLGSLANTLLDKPRARRDASLVQERLELLQIFYENDAKKLREALRSTGRPGSYISQEERDSLFIRSSFVD